MRFNHRLSRSVGIIKTEGFRVFFTKYFFPFFKNAIHRNWSYIVEKKSSKFLSMGLLAVQRCQRTMNFLDRDPLTIKEPAIFPVIDICIVTFNSSRWVEVFIESVLALDYPKTSTNLFFVDNGSTDDTVLKLKKNFDKLEKKGVKVFFQQSTNIGFGRGNNRAIKMGLAPFCLVTNIDLEFESDALKKLASIAIEDEENVVAWEPRQKPYEHPKFYDPVTGFVNWNSHACVLIRRSAFEKVGGYDKNIFMYGEDVELSYRFRQLGFLLRYCPQAVVWHYSYQNPGEFKATQYLGSIFANFYLRVKYGNFFQILTIPFLMLGLFFYTIKSHSRYLFPQLLKSMFRLAKITPKILIRKPFRKKLFCFSGFDYDFAREGSFFTLKALPKDPPLVSIITRTYEGRGLFLRQALLSVAHQTYPNIEHLIVQDGGDSLRDVVENISDVTGKAIQFIAAPKRGRSFAGNMGLHSAAGRWCLFLDDDDLLFSDHIEVLVGALLDHPKSVASYALSLEIETRVFSDGYREVFYNSPSIFKQDYSYEVLFDHNYIPIQSILFERALFEALGGFKEDLDALEDWNLWLRYAQGNNFIFVPKLTSMYRVPADRISRKKRVNAFSAAYRKAKIDVNVL